MLLSIFSRFGYNVSLVIPIFLKISAGKVKGNCDAELVLQAMIDIDKYDKAIIVTSDGDFHCLVDYLYKKNKLDRILSPCRDHCSILLRKSGKEKIVYMDNLRNKLEYK